MSALPSRALPTLTEVLELTELALPQACQPAVDPFAQKPAAVAAKPDDDAAQLRSLVEAAVERACQEMRPSLMARVDVLVREAMHRRSPPSPQ